MKTFDLIVIGGGTGGLRTVSNAAALGKSVAVIENRKGKSLPIGVPADKVGQGDRAGTVLVRYVNLQVRGQVDVQSSG